MTELKFRRFGKAPTHHFTGYVFPGGVEDFDAATGCYEITPHYIGKKVFTYEVTYIPMHQRGAVVSRRERISLAPQLELAKQDAQRDLEARTHLSEATAVS